MLIIPKQEIAAAIRGGAMTFLREEYQIIALVVALVALASWLLGEPYGAGCFIFGAVLSMHWLYWYECSN